jgi:dTDP-4-amino-4,6-dideoxygalactose transaminase
VEGIFQRDWLTNNGPLVSELELRLKDYLNLEHLLFLSNGTIALQIAIKALELKGEIITTPFSYVATTSSIVWEGCVPVFVDIQPDTLNIDPAKIEAAVTGATTAILATHVYGNPCDIAAIDAVARRRNLKVIYDAAHCFGTRYKGQSVFAFGDVSTTSFHATKLFHTIEGGAVITRDAELLNRMAFMRNFGHNGPEDFAEVGINGKNSEFHAAMGLANLKYIDEILEKRKTVSRYYDDRLATLRVQRIVVQEDAEFNYAYYPIVFSSEGALLKAVRVLQDNWVYPRRYFYPGLNTLKYVNPASLPVSDDLSRRVLVLPLSHGLGVEEVDYVARLLLRAQTD